MRATTGGPVADLDTGRVRTRPGGSAGRSGVFPASTDRAARAESSGVGLRESAGGRISARALQALQRQAGNQATARLLQRAAPVAAMGPGMTGGTEDQTIAAPPRIYPVMYGGMEFQVPDHEMPRLLEHIGPALWKGAITELGVAFGGVRDEYRTHGDIFSDQPMVGSVLQLVSGARLPHAQVAAADEGLRHARHMVMALMKAPSPRAALDACEAVRAAEALVIAAGTAVNAYRAAMIGGGEATVFTLEVTRDVSFAVAAAAGAAVLAPAGATVGATVAAGAMTEGTAELVKEMATATGRKMSGTAQSAEDTITDIAYALAKGTVLGGVGGLLKPVSDALSEKLSARLLHHFARLGKGAADYLAGQVVNNVISAKINVPVDIVEHMLQSDDPITSEQLMDYLLEQARRRGIAEGVKGLLVKP